ncbi:MAG: T9SS C-terminal target domain-containing protein [Calditrichaeota bacterium]|nr:MAG: T9SS C-terminal target domain-containing protein [Calditrichota bacterium]
MNTILNCCIQHVHRKCMFGDRMKRILLFFIVIVLTALLPCALHAQKRLHTDEWVDIPALEKKQNAWRFDDTGSNPKVMQESESIDVGYYKLDLVIEPQNRLLSGSVVVKGRSKVSNLKNIVLNLDERMIVDAVTGDAQHFTHSANLLEIALNSTLGQSEEFTVEIFYHGTPAGGGFGGFGFNSQAEEPVIWSLSEPYFARTWWPCKDYPNDKADSVDIVLTVPEHLTAVSNGSLVEVISNEDQTSTFHWHEKYPITTYLVSVAITNYAKYSQWFKYSPDDSMEITNYIYPAKLEDAKIHLASLPEIMAFFHETFGPYPFLDEKYGIAQFPWGGGMEHQTISSQGSFVEYLNAHELAHQWFGDLITTANWQDIWLNEGFATYSEALYYEHANGTDYYHEYMARMSVKYSEPIYRADTTSVNSIFNRIVYYKGAWVVHMLRKVLGDETFFALLKAYTSDARFAYGNVTTTSFKEFCEKFSGRELDWFFNQWIFGTGQPAYRYEWDVKNENNSFVVDLRIEQTQVDQHQLFTMPVEILISSETQDTLVTILNDQETQQLRIPVSFPPRYLTLDPDNWILKDVDTLSTIDDGKVRLGIELKQNFPNPFYDKTTIDFNLYRTVAYVELKIFNTRGQFVHQQHIDLPNLGSNSFQWDGTNFNGTKVTSGVYIYQIESPIFNAKMKMVHLH